MQNPSGSIGYDAEMSPEHPEESSEHRVCDDYIIAAVSEDTPKVQESVNRKRKFVASKIDSFFDFVPKQSKTSADQSASLNPIQLNVSGAQKVSDPVKEKDKARKNSSDEKHASPTSKNAVRKSSETYMNLRLKNEE